MQTLPGRILVTGAGGFVGSHLLPALRQALPDAWLCAVGPARPVLGGKSEHGWDAAVALDLAAPDGLAAMLRALRPDAVVHLAAQAAVPESFRDPLQTWRINLFGTLALGEAIRQETPAAGLIFASSAEAYGLSFQSGEALRESAPFAPANPYAASKAAADLALGELALRGLDVLRLRPFNMVGPGQSIAFALPAFATQVARIEAGLQPAELRTGALDRWRDFLDVRDFCAAVALALRQGFTAGQVFNVASGQPRRIGDALAALCALAGISPRLETVAAALRPTDVIRSCGDAGAIRAALGWAPAIPWETSLRDVLADARARLKA